MKWAPYCSYHTSFSKYNKRVVGIPY